MSKYDPSLTLDRDKVRLLVGDTDDDHQMLVDTEIEFALTEEADDIYLASARLCEIIAARFARDVNYRFSTLWLDSGDAYDHFLSLAERYRTESSRNTGQPIFTMGEGVDDEAPEIFWYGMHDNPPVSQTED